MNLLTLYILVISFGPSVRSATPCSMEFVRSHLVGMPIAHVAQVTGPIGVPSPLFGIGIGYPRPGSLGAQARLLARRAAEVRAVADLARQLDLPSNQRLRGMQFISYQVWPDGSVEVIAALRRS